jgi:hypothetical protein
MSQAFYIAPAAVVAAIEWRMVDWPTGGGWNVGPRLVRRGPLAGEYVIAASIRDVIPEAARYSRLLDKLPTVELDLDQGNGLEDPPELTVIVKTQTAPVDPDPTPPLDLRKS